MTTRDFSNAFDILLNSYNIPTKFGTDNSIGGITFDEYEKSMFLTQAQEQIVVELYSGRNEFNTSFEVTEESRAYLKDLIKTYMPKESTVTPKGISKYSKFYSLPNDVLFITYESAILSDDSLGCRSGEEVTVVPVTQDEFDSTFNNPFRGPSKRRVLRLDNGSGVAEVISRYNIKDYTIRYISKPSPIILSDLEDLTIGGDNKESNCKLNSALHEYILRRAVALALASRGRQNTNV